MTVVAIAVPVMVTPLHADGPPDVTPFTDRTDLLWELEGLAAGDRR